MKKQPLILIISGLCLVAALFIFGRTSAPKKPTSIPTVGEGTPKAFDIQSFINSSKSKLTSSQVLYVTELENGITRGDIATQQITAYNALANFWKDSANLFEPYAYYTYQSSVLENSEKNLTFAAQLFLDALRAEHDDAKIDWEAGKAIELFEKALLLNPENDDLRIGLGSCYVFGKGRGGDAAQTMKGIQELLSVVKKDSNNLKAQFVLGVGGLVSGQHDKAIERFTKVVTAQPNNLEAIAFMADTYAAKGDKTNAVKWYNISKRLANSPSYAKEVDERIKQLQ